MVETEPEFDVNERDSWYALAELRAATCPHCGNLRLVCEDPGGWTGEGFHLTQHVCYPTLILDATRRRVQRKYEKAQPDLQGFLPTDGVLIGVALADDGSDDLLGLAAPDDGSVVSALRQSVGDRNQAQNASDRGEQQ